MPKNEVLLKNLMLFLLLLAPSSFLWAQTPPGACECQYAGKDYDTDKGFYFDRVNLLPFPHVSGRFGCIYYCQDTQGKYWTVTHVYEGWYLGTAKGGPENAKKMICPQAIAEFIPKYDLMGQVIYYETTPVGNFSAKDSSVAEIKSWSDASCK